MADPGGAPGLIRICLDLNVWIADFLSTRRERRSGSSAWLADAVRSGMSPAGPVQLVVSLGMLDRLASVLTREFAVPPILADALVRAISNIAEFGPAGDYPHVVVGGSVYPIRDVEDRHVLEVAVAGHADVLATANLRDFDMDDIEKVGSGSRVRIYVPPGRNALVIAHPDHVCAWLRAGVVLNVDIARESLPQP